MSKILEPVAFKDRKRDWRRAARPKGHPDRIRVLRQRLILKKYWEEVARELTQRDGWLEFDRDSTKKVKLSGGMVSRLIRKITGFSASAVKENRKSNQMLSGRFARASLNGMIKLAHDQLQELHDKVRDQQALLGDLHELHDIVSEKQLFSFAQYPAGDPDAEEKSWSVTSPAKVMMMLRVRNV